MSKSLDDIFNNIHQSEEESNAQYDYLKKLKNNISAADNKVKENEKLCCELQEEISKKLKRLANREVVLLSLEVRQKCLQDRIQELKSENKDLKNTMEALKVRLKRSRENLCQQSSKFIEEHNFFNRKQRCASYLNEEAKVETNNALIKDIPEKLSAANETTVTSRGETLLKLSRKDNSCEDENSLMFDIDFGKEDPDWLQKIS